VEVTDFTSKADTLLYLREHVKSAEILPVFKVFFSDWSSDKSEVINKLSTLLVKQPLIVRSSCVDEDTATSSNAGHYDSILNVSTTNLLAKAIDEVFQSYKGNIYPSSHVLVQPQLEEIQVSGVAFTQDPNNGGYYYIVNYDDNSGDSQSITSGYSQKQSLEYWFHLCEEVFSGWRKLLFNLLQELLHIYINTPLDVEFAVDKNKKLFLFQVRPLIFSIDNDCSVVEDYQQILQVKKKVSRLSQRHPHLVGKSTIFANMPDWNPAEIIGCKPKPLALSLYKELVTDGIWAYQRKKYQYRDLRSFPLMIDFAHSPYIDTRVSFNSFIPESLSEELAEKLVNYYIEQLEMNPQLQDKIEFDIVISCFTFDINERLSNLPVGLLTKTEKSSFLEALKLLTLNIIEPNSGLLINDLIKVDKLKARQEKVLSTELNKIEKIYWLIEDCKRYGTLPFAGIARAGFIGKQFLDSLVKVGALSIDRVELFNQSLNTVSSEYLSDIKSLPKSDFLRLYGHLRAGTYDIDSPRYDEMSDKIFNNNKATNDEIAHFELTNNEKIEIDKLLGSLGFPLKSEELFVFCRKAIEGRERAKFIFSKSISEVLQLIKSIGNDIRIPSDQLAYLNIKDIKSLYGSTFSAINVFSTSIEQHRLHYKRCLQINLPPMISADTSIEQFKIPECQPNFVTSKAIIAQATTNLENSNERVVFINNADPGFDWLFTKNIAGLITMYGGANSHMAIRAGELGIPAVIGAGEVNYNYWKNAQLLSVDCLHKKVDVLS